MKRSDRELLHRSVDGPLSAEDDRRLRELLAANADARTERATLLALRERMRPAVRREAARAVRPFFTDRVMRAVRRVEGSVRAPEELLAGALSWGFWRLGLAASIVVLVLAAYNLRTPRPYEADRKAIEVVLALPPVSIDTAFEYDFPGQRP
jgi:anti-sigma factor RsiW